MLSERQIFRAAKKDGYHVGKIVSYLNGAPVYKVTAPDGTQHQWTAWQLSDRIFAVFD